MPCNTWHCQTSFNTPGSCVWLFPDTYNHPSAEPCTYSIHVQVVCNTNNFITNVVAKFPGSIHDRYIFRNSSVYRMVQNMDDNSRLLGKKVVLRKHCWSIDCKGVGESMCFCITGDRGYQLQPWMMTPVCNPTNDREAAYNRAHIKTLCDEQHSHESRSAS